MTINKKLLGASLLLFSSVPAFSVPAYPGLLTVKQDDGSTLTIRRVGDEYHNIVVSEDGYALLYNKDTRNYEYAQLSDSKLMSSGIAAANAESRSVKATEFLKGIDREAIEKKFSADWAAAKSKAEAPRKGKAGASKIVRNNYNVPTTGDRDVLVILVDFKDRKFSDFEEMPDPAAYYDKFFHQEGFSEYGCHGSAYEFYYKSSLGKYRPNFHVLGPIQVSGGYADYAGNGGSSLTYTLIKEVVPLADKMYDIDFSIFDTDGDGLVDNVYCLYAGYGQADSPVTNSIWPHSYNLGAVHAEFEVDGVTINRYTVSQQLNGVSKVPVGIGTFVHEFGHVLGLADHYNNSSSFGNPTNNVGNWDLMSAGSYNNDQNCPAPFSAFERYSLGWYEPEVLDPKEAKKIMVSPYMEEGKAYRV
ncbi:MAG: M6 family metalloprotease domain-containing protein [Muribaculaceae bacterium]|nr:M6 family metalloprotease domain-containing protein [Muribaculaceae bacterium]